MWACGFGVVGRGGWLRSADACSGLTSLYCMARYIKYDEAYWVLLLSDGFVKGNGTLQQ